MSNAELIDEARPKTGTTYRRVTNDLMRRLADALDVADGANQQLRIVNRTLQRQLVAAQAAIAAVLKLTGDIGPEARRILTQLPADALEAHTSKAIFDYEMRRKAATVHIGNIDGQNAAAWLKAHDRQVAGKALTDAAHDWDEVPDRTPRTGTDTSPWLRRRAAAIVSEPSTPEQEPDGLTYVVCNRLLDPETNEHCEFDGDVKLDPKRSWRCPGCRALRYEPEHGGEHRG